jgi:uncharacterized surface protein with fasciclin (FAS1) repeats
MSTSFTRALIVTAATLAMMGCNRSEAPAQNNAASDEASSEAAPRGTLLDALNGVSNGKLRAALVATGLDRTLAGPGPYTVLAPSDPAFDKLPAGALDGLMKEGARPELTGVLTYHILPGTMLSADIAKAIKTGGGKAVLATMAGGTITAIQDGGKLVLSDSAGTRAIVTAADEQHSNGVIHRLDAVLMPKASN